MNGRVIKTFGQLYSATMAREAKPKDLGYNIVVMWEIDWRLFVFRIKRIQRRVKMWLLPPNAHNVATLSALPTKVGFGAAHQNLGATAWLPNQGCRRAALCAALRLPQWPSGTGNNARVDWPFGGSPPAAGAFEYLFLDRWNASGRGPPPAVALRMCRMLRDAFTSRFTVMP